MLKGYFIEQVFGLALSGASVKRKTSSSLYPTKIKDLQKLLLEGKKDQGPTILEEVIVTGKREGSSIMKPKSIPSTLNKDRRKPGDWGYMGSVYSASDAAKAWKSKTSKE
jgi:hypothetical protein